MRRSNVAGLTVLGIGLAALVVTALAASLHAAITSGGSVAAFWTDYWAEFVNTLLTVIVLSLVIGAGVEALSRRRADAHAAASAVASRAATGEMIVALIEPVHAAAFGYLLNDEDAAAGGDVDAWMRRMLEDLDGFTERMLGETLVGDVSDAQDVESIMEQFRSAAAAAYRRGRAQRTFAVRSVHRELELLHLSDLEEGVRTSVGRMRMQGFHFLLATTTTDENLAAPARGETHVDALLDAVPRGAVLDGRITGPARMWLAATAAARRSLAAERRELAQWIQTGLILIRAERDRPGART